MSLKASKLNLPQTPVSDHNVWIQNTKMTYFLFTLMCLGYICNGINLSIIGPSIDELANIYGISLQNISFGFTIKAISNCICSILAGFTMSRYSRHLQYSIALIIYGINTCLLPQLPSINYFWIAWAVYGGTSAFIDIAINVWIPELFELRNMNLHVQIVHLNFALGQVFGPLMIGPYLMPKQTNDTDPNLITIAQQSKMIVIPYLAAGSCFIFVGSIVFICFLILPYQPPKRKIFGPKRDAQGSIALSSEPEVQTYQKSLVHSCWFRCVFVILIVSLFSVEVSSEYNLFMYLAPYLNRKHWHLGKQTVAHLSAMFGFCYVIGRSASMLLAMCRRIPVTTVFYVQMTTALVACIMIRWATAATSGWYIQTAVCLIGLGFSSAFPNMMVFIEQRVNITDRLNCAMLAFSTLLFSMCSHVIGNLLHSKPNSFEIIMIAAILLIAFTFALIHSTDLIRKRTHSRSDPKFGKTTKL